MPFAVRRGPAAAALALALAPLAAAFPVPKGPTPKPAGPTAADAKALGEKFRAERAEAAKTGFAADALAPADDLASRAEAALKADNPKAAARYYRDARWQVPYRPAGLPPHVARVLGESRMRHPEAGKPGTEWVNAVAYSPDGSALASAGADGTARVWQAVARPSEDGDLTGTGDGLLTAAAVGGMGGAFLAADETGRAAIRLAEPMPGRGTGPLWMFNIPIVAADRVPVRAVAVAPDGGGIVAAGDKELLVWRLFVRPRGGRDGPPPVPPVAQRPHRLVYGRAATLMAVDPDGRVLITRDREAVRVWDFRRLLLVHTGEAYGRAPPVVHPGADVGAVAAEARTEDGGGRIALGVGAGVKLVDRFGRVLADRPDAHPAPVTAAAFGPDRLATADANGLVKVWRVRPDGGLDHLADLAGHTDAVTALGFAPDGKTLATGGADRTVVLWDPETGQERIVLTGHGDRLLTVQFNPDGGGLVTVGRDGVVKRWRADPPGGPPLERGTPPPPFRRGPPPSPPDQPAPPPPRG